jgi:signal transduction histidine kinase
MDLRPTPAVRDVLIAVVAASAALAVQVKTDVAAIDPRLRAPDVLTIALTVAGPLALFWWRSHPLRAFAMLTLCGTVVSATSHYVGVLPWLVAISLYTASVHSARRHSLAALGVAWLSYTGLTVAGVPDNSGDGYVSTTALLVTAAALGHGLRLRRDRIAADLRAARGAAAAAREEAARATVEERLRIARELHDVVAHSMSLIAIQAGVGAHLIHTRPAQAERALTVIAETSREALAQTRSLLGLLRGEEADSPTAPVPRLAELDALIAAVRRTGVVIDFSVQGDPRQIAPAVQLAAYRIVQESLTNMVKHADAPTASVRLRYEDAVARIEVVDDGVGHRAGSGGSGHGLRGLRERALLLRGSLTAGPAAGGGWRVSATLPLHDASQLREASPAVVASLAVAP